MKPQTPFFKSRSSGGISSAFRKKEAGISAAVFAVAALAAALFFGGKAFTAFQLFPSAAAAAPNASLPVSAQARGVPQLPQTAQPANPESLALIGQYPEGVNGRHWRGDLAGQTVTSLISPNQAARRLFSVALPMRLPPGLSAAAPDAVVQALGTTSVPRSPRATIKGRFRGRWFSRRYKLGALSPCSGFECAFRKLSDVRVLTADHNPCLAIKGCVVENAVADENAVYDGSLAAPSLGASPLNQSAPEINTGAQSGLGGQNDASAATQAQNLSQDAQRCAAANALYFGTPERPGPQIVAQQDFSRAYEGLESSGCLSANDSLCAASRGKAGELCRQFDAVRLAHYEACPIDQRMGPYEPAQCVL